MWTPVAATTTAASIHRSECHNKAPHEDSMPIGPQNNKVNLMFTLYFLRLQINVQAAFASIARLNAEP